MILTLDILLDDVIGDITATTAEVSSRPKMPPPVTFTQMRVLVQQFERSLAFKFLDQTTDRDLGRDRHEQMDVILGHVAFDDIHIFPLANFSDHIPNSEGNRPFQNLFPVLRDPDQVQMDRKNRMRTMPVCAHGGSLDKDC